MVANQIWHRPTSGNEDAASPTVFTSWNYRIHLARHRAREKSCEKSYQTMQDTFFIASLCNFDMASVRVVAHGRTRPLS